jgi:hypothetical protein
MIPNSIILLRDLRSQIPLSQRIESQKLISTHKMMLLATFLIIQAVIAWEIDPRCPDPVFTRRLQKETKLSNDEEHLGQSLMNRHLRRKEGQRHRDLQSFAVAAPFQIKMFWQDYYCWQEEWIERAWCWSCKGDTCERGENIWIQFCDANNPAQKFIYVPVAGSGGGRIQTASNNLCFDRVGNNNYTLSDCSSTEKQIFMGFETDGTRMEIIPKGAPLSCLNQAHHPKAGEIIETTTCKVARYWHTNEFTVYHGTSTSNPYSASNLSTLRVRKNACTSSRPCEICEGDCQTDDDCKGTMLCFHRSNQAQQVPGCFGKGIGGITGGENYCYDPKSPVIKGSNTTDTALSSPGCSKEKPCAVCQGDCDNDDECAGDLVCQQKAGPGSVPGCLGFDNSGTDFCVKPRVGVSPTSGAPVTGVPSTRSPVKLSPTLGVVSRQPAKVTRAPTANVAHVSGTSVLSLRKIECSKNNPCTMCQGDCDNDDECEGILICKFKDTGGSIEGCAGFDNSKSDFCTMPSLGGLN